MVLFLCWLGTYCRCFVYGVVAMSWMIKGQWLCGALVAVGCVMQCCVCINM
jgi:hypothetical protein